MNGKKKKKKKNFISYDQFRSEISDCEQDYNHL